MSLTSRVALTIPLGIRGAFGLLVFLATALGAADFPRPENGVISGRDAISMLVTDTRYDTPRRTIFPSEGFNVHLIPGGDWRRVAVYPCGEWFLPEPGSYHFYIEGNGKVSPFLGAFSFSGRRRTGHGKLAAYPVVKAGKVITKVAEGLPRSSTVRLFHLSSHIIDGSLHGGMQRQAGIDTAGEGILMPSGPVVALLFDDVQGRYVALARPMDVPPAGSATIELRPPAPGTFELLLVVRRSEKTVRVEDDAVEVEWKGAGALRPADVKISTAGRVYAIWYGVRTQGVATIRAGTYVETVPVSFGAGRVRRIEHSLPHTKRDGVAYGPGPFP